MTPLCFLRRTAFGLALRGLMGIAGLAAAPAAASVLLP